MSCELELTKATRLRLAHAFRDVPRVDYSIDCVLEGQMGRVLTDNPFHPIAYCLITGPFCYFAGSTTSIGGLMLAREFAPGLILMPSAAGWLPLLQKVFPDGWAAFPRYSFSPDQLSEKHLNDLLEQCPSRVSIAALDDPLTARLSSHPDGMLEIHEFDSTADFLERGFGFVALNGDDPIGAAYSSLVCSRGIEVSIYIEKRWRERGVGTALACQLLLECLQRGLRPNWDAANTESYKLAKKLGFVFTAAYDAYYLDPN